MALTACHSQHSRAGHRRRDLIASGACVSAIVRQRDADQLELRQAVRGACLCSEISSEVVVEPCDVWRWVALGLTRQGDVAAKLLASAFRINHDSNRI